MTTSVSPPRVLSHKATLIGVAVPTPTRKDGTPIPLADTPPEGFQKVRLPRTDAPPEDVGVAALAQNSAESPRSQAPAPEIPPAPALPADPAKLEASLRVTRRDLPVHGTPRSQAPDAASIPPAAPTSSSRWLGIGALVAAVVLTTRWYAKRHEPVQGPHETTTTAAPTGVAVVPPTSSATAEAPATSATTDAPAPSAAAPTTEAPPAPIDSAAPAASDAAAAAPPAAEGTRVVIVKINPPQARLFRHGKPVGASPVTIELPPDERKRFYEVGMPGYVTRKLVVDGTKPEIFIGLKPESAPPKH